MDQIGIVAEANAKTAKIRVARESACGGNCASCNASCGGKNGFYLVENTEQLQTGDRVRLRMSGKNFIRQAVLGYGLLVLALAGGIGAGYWVTKADGPALLIGICVFLAAILCQRFWYSKHPQNIKIEKIVN